MTEIDIQLREIEDPTAAIARIDAAIERTGLVTTMKGTLKSYPGCKHWHCKLGRESGTLEITYWPAKRRAWIKIQNARRAKWMDGIVPTLKQILEM